MASLCRQTFKTIQGKDCCIRVKICNLFTSIFMHQYILCIFKEHFNHHSITPSQLNLGISIRLSRKHKWSWINFTCLWQQVQWRGKRKTMDCINCCYVSLFSKNDVQCTLVKIFTLINLFIEIWCLISVPLIVLSSVYLIQERIQYWLGSNLS